MMLDKLCKENQKNYKCKSIQFLILLIIVFLTSGLFFGFDYGDLGLFIFGVIVSYIIYKKEGGRMPYK